MSESNYDALKLENQLCFPLYAASRRIINQYPPYLSQLDITYTQYVTMMVLWEEKRISVKNLGHRLFLDSGTLTPVLKSLEAKGYISRSRSKDDERVLIVEITSQGEALKESALDIPRQVSGCVKLTADEAVTLYRLLYKVLEGTGQQ